MPATNREAFLGTAFQVAAQRHPGRARALLRLLCRTYHALAHEKPEEDEEEDEDEDEGGGGGEDEGEGGDGGGGGAGGGKRPLTSKPAKPVLRRQHSKVRATLNALPSSH
jgi:hypothetical protein